MHVVHYDSKMQVEHLDEQEIVVEVLVEFTGFSPTKVILFISRVKFKIVINLLGMIWSWDLLLAESIEY